MKKEISIIIKNGLTGECIKLPNVEDMSVKQKEALIEAYTEQMTSQNIGYYISYSYEV